MKKIAILALVAVVPTLSTAMVFALPPLQTNSSIVKLSLNQGGTANIIVRQKGTNGLETLHQWLYSCKLGTVVTAKTAAVDIVITEVVPFPERALQIKAYQFVDGKTNSLNWIVTERCDLIPENAFGAIIPKAISPDGKVFVGMVSAGFSLTNAKPEPPSELSRPPNHVFNGQRFQSLASYSQALDTERWRSIQQSIQSGTLYFIVAAAFLVLVVGFIRNPPARASD